MSDEEFEELKQDIDQNGLLDDIILLEGKILDGRHRFEACQEIDKSPKFKDFEDLSISSSPLDYILSENLKRRHLNSSQRAAIAAEADDIIEELEEEAEKREKAGKEVDPSQKVEQGNDPNKQKTDNKLAESFDTNRQYVTDAKNIKEEDPDAHEKIKEGDETISGYKKEKRKQEREKETEPETSTPDLPDSKYKTLVIDPPWDMEKIDREVRPKQGKYLDYPVMNIEEIKDLPIGNLLHESGGHIYLWTTQKYLPKALEILENWNARYECLLTWKKPTGVAPFSWQYNTEHILFARYGSGLNLKKNGLQLSFEAPVTEHSEKPDIFYQKVKKASPEPRLEMFARKEREGFDTWGDEIE